jgi:hypothetical protein
MTVRNFYTNDPSVLTTSISETYGGQELRINISYEFQELLNWWRQWGPIFKDGNATVQDALVQARVLHELAKEQNGQVKTYGWTETTL